MDERFDTDPHFRVFDLLRGNPLASSEGSFFNKNIGGYHAAKLRRFQELADKYILDKEQSRFVFPDNMNVLGMLNAKYVLQSPDAPTRNPYALGNAWFVDSLKIVANADEELAGLIRKTERLVVLALHADGLNALDLVVPAEHQRAHVISLDG